MKLRDYLFLAKTSANKVARERRKMIKARSNSKDRVSTEEDLRESMLDLRKNKYSITNSEMVQILKE
jgi:hypothetical protein